MKETRYFVDRDESGDYYCVPVNQKEQWQEWIDGGYEESDTPPGDIFYIGGHASCITFTNPE